MMDIQWLASARYTLQGTAHFFFSAHFVKIMNLKFFQFLPFTSCTNYTPCDYVQSISFTIYPTSTPSSISPISNCFLPRPPFRRTQLIFRHSLIPLHYRQKRATRKKESHTHSRRNKLSTMLSRQTEPNLALPGANRPSKILSKVGLMKHCLASRDNAWCHPACSKSKIDWWSKPLYSETAICP
jgi:hypothetical protein